MDFPDEGLQVYYPAARTSKDFRQVDGKDANHLGLGNARTEKGRQNEVENMGLPGLQHEILLNPSQCRYTGECRCGHCEVAVQRGWTRQLLSSQRIIRVHEQFLRPTAIAVSH